MKLFPRSLQARTAVVIALAFFVFLSLFFITTYFSIRSSLIARSDGEAYAELRQIAGVLHPGLSKDTLAYILSEHRSIGESSLRFVILEQQGNSYHALTSEVESTLPLDIERKIEQHPGEPVAYSTPEGNMRLISMATSGFIIGVNYKTLLLEEAEDSIIHVFAYYLAAGLFIGIFGGIFLSKYLIGPISSLANAAKAILYKPKQSPARLPVTNKIEEVAGLARSINELLDAREQALERQRNFAADAAHELRTPLTVLKGEIEVELRVIDSKSPQAEILRSNLEEIERLISTVQDLLELADIEAEPRQDTDGAECSLLEAIRYAVDRLHAFAKERGVNIMLPEQDVTIRAQERRITRLVYNLLLNAVQNSSAGSSVIIRTKAKPVGVVLEIEDRGTGIPSERIERLFERFYRAGNEDRRGGAGLGLAIVKSIADHYGFMLEVQSMEGFGTTVFVKIPLSSVN
jgi:signal transduction histidine kinase